MGLIGFVYFLLKLLWLGVNVYLFVDTFRWYEEEESFLYTRVILGVSRVNASYSFRKRT